MDNSFEIFDEKELKQAQQKEHQIRNIEKVDRHWALDQKYVMEDEEQMKKGKKVLRKVMKGHEIVQPKSSLFTTGKVHNKVSRGIKRTFGKKITAEEKREKQAAYKAMDAMHEKMDAYKDQKEEEIGKVEYEDVKKDLEQFMKKPLAVMLGQDALQKRIEKENAPQMHLEYFDNIFEQDQKKKSKKPKTTLKSKVFQLDISSDEKLFQSGTQIYGLKKSASKMRNELDKLDSGQRKRIFENMGIDNNAFLVKCSIIDRLSKYLDARIKVVNSEYYRNNRSDLLDEGRSKQEADLVKNIERSKQVWNALQEALKGVGNLV